MGGWVDGGAGFMIAYSNKKSENSKVQFYLWFVVLTEFQQENLKYFYHSTKEYVKYSKPLSICFHLERYFSDVNVDKKGMKFELS